MRLYPTLGFAPRGSWYIPGKRPMFAGFITHHDEPILGNSGTYTLGRSIAPGDIYARRRIKSGLCD